MASERMTAAEYRCLPRKSRTTPETALKRAAVQWLQLHGWLTYPLVQGMGAVRGLPDRIAIKDGMTVYLEFKSPRGRLSAAQERVRAEIEAAGAPYLVVRDLADLEKLDEIARATRGGYTEEQVHQLTDWAYRVGYNEGVAEGYNGARREGYCGDL